MLQKYLSRLRGLKKERKPLPNTIFKKPLHFIAFGFGVGAIPFAPGTFGTLLAACFYSLILDFSFSTRLIITLLLTIVAIIICGKVSRNIKIHDHPGMCLDEFPGFFVAMLFAPQTMKGLIIAFILFRIFDILKPWPINWIDKNIHGGFGMVFDDVVAGIVVALIFIVSGYF